MWKIQITLWIFFIICICLDHYTHTHNQIQKKLHWPECVDTKTQIPAAPCKHTHTHPCYTHFQIHQHGLMCLAQLFHLLLSEAFCDEGIFQVANHYSLQAPGSSKDCLNMCVCVSAHQSVCDLHSLMVMVIVQPK